MRKSFLGFVFFKTDDCVEVILGKKMRLLLFSFPNFAFHFISTAFEIDWNVWKPMHFYFWWNK